MLQNTANSGVDMQPQQADYNTYTYSNYEAQPQQANYEAPQPQQANYEAPQQVNSEVPPQTDYTYDYNNNFEMQPQQQSEHDYYTGSDAQPQQMDYDYGYGSAASQSPQTEEIGEDQLLAQIDAFREKAMQLQTLINERESKVKDLEQQNSNLQKVLNRKQEEADGLVADVETQVDRMMRTIQGNMAELQNRIENHVFQNQDGAVAQAEAMKEVLGNLNTDLEGIRDGMAEKIHTENVKVYRNIRDLLQEMDHREEDAEAQQKQMQPFKSRLNLVTGISVLNLLLLIVVFLYSTGIMSIFF